MRRISLNGVDGGHDGGGHNQAHPFDVEPGIYFDKNIRVFTLQGRSMTYAFRVDDDKNLEHLYWGPKIPNSDDLLYLTKSHVAGPFDPVGSVPAASVAKLLGLNELSGIDHNAAEKWKVFTKQKDSEDGDIRGRRLENASWRIWNKVRNNGGDLSVDVSESKLKSSLKMERASSASSRDSSPPRPTPSSLPIQSTILLDGDKTKPHNITGKGHATSIVERPQATSTNDTTARSALGLLPVKSVGDFSDFGKYAGVRPGIISPGPTSPALAPRRDPGHFGASSFGDVHGVVEMAWQNLDSTHVGKNTKLLEWSDCGTGDYREPSFKLRFEKDGSSICPLQFKNYHIVSRKLNMPSTSLPTVYTESSDEATTLIVEMEDPISKLKFMLYYTVMHDYDIIIRRSTVINEGDDPVVLEHLSSGMVDFDAEHQYYLTQLSGGWARERQVVTRKLEDGVTVVKSVRGTSSHQFNPFVVVSPDREPSEDDGECFGFCLVYSGNFSVTAEVSEYQRLRMNVGINQEMFSWRLDSVDGEDNIFYSPEVIMSYSNSGLGALSRDMHRLIRERLVPPQWRYKVPPVLLNTWEAVYFDFKHETIVDIAVAAKKANVEMLVLDDGWFGKRNDTTTSLGDWYPNREKLPYGLNGLVRAVNDAGLKFGIWIEPEMVSVDSDLYRAHPDWCLFVPQRKHTLGRNQLVLDFARQEVVDYMYEQIEKILSTSNIEYVKWDMNRHLTEMFSRNIPAERQGEVSHRFILGVYSMFKRLTTRFPYVRFESCSGGGGRFDAGMLAFTSQIWTSDNTDAMSRMTIQFGTSLAYPLSTMGSHVSVVPNHQTGRSATMKTRSLLAMCGTFGYELDPRDWDADTIEEIQGYVKLFKRLSSLIYEGDLYRIWNPFRTTSMAWMIVSRDKLRAIVFAFKVTREVGRLEPRLKIRGIRPDLLYCVEELCPGTVTMNPQNGAIIHDPRGVYQIGKRIDVTGRTLMSAGLPVKFLFDGDSVCYELNAVDRNGVALLRL